MTLFSIRLLRFPKERNNINNAIVIVFFCLFHAVSIQFLLMVGKVEGKVKLK